MDHVFHFRVFCWGRSNTAATQVTPWVGFAFRLWVLKDFQRKTKSGSVSGCYYRSCWRFWFSPLWIDWLILKCFNPCRSEQSMVGCWDRSAWLWFTTMNLLCNLHRLSNKENTGLCIPCFWKMKRDHCKLGMCGIEIRGPGKAVVKWNQLDSI